MKLKHCYLFVMAAALCAALLGCAVSEPPAESTSAAPQETASAPSTAPTVEPSAQAPEDGQSAVLYVGTRRAGFQEYAMDYQGELTPELLIQGIADLTGWDLTLAEPVTDGKGGMSVCLAEGSSLFQGPPDPQKDEFHVFSAEQLAQTILDSIQKTLQQNFVAAPGDPDKLDIYFYMEGEQALELPELGLSWPLDQPYQWPQ